jgi:protease IV
MKSFFLTLIAIIVADILIVGIVALVLVAKTSDSPDVESGSVLVQRIAGDIPEFSPPSTALSLGEPSLCQTTILENLEKARRDKRIRAVVLRFDSPALGWAKMNEIRDRIVQLKESGKPVWGYAQMMDNRTLYLGSACDSLFFLPAGYVSLHGFAGERPFVKGTLEKLGIKQNIHRIEKYKSAAEIIQRSDLSPEARRNIEWIYDATYPTFVSAIEEGRRLDPGTFEQTALAQPAISPRELLSFNLVDRLAYWDQVETSLLKIEGVKPAKKKSKSIEPRPRIVQGAAYGKIPREKAGIKAKKKIAVIHAQGMIEGEKSGTNIPFGATLGGATMEEAFRSASEDKEIAAIVFRIDSGGGESSTSWRISRAAIRAGQAKPLVVSMNDMAASGAYLIAYPCSTIVAERLSVVGSIGSISGKFNLRGLYEKLGITKDFVTRGPNGLADSDYFDYTPEQWESFTSHHWADYMEWVEDIARYRHMTPAEVDSIGRGRVWTGEQALERGLIDTLGTFDVAVAIAKKKAGIRASDEVQFVHYPRPTGFLESLREGGLAAAVISLVERTLAPFVRQGTWAVDWNDYRGN